MFTAEFAAGLPALVLLVGVGVTAVGAVHTRLWCLDAAREAALAHARGAAPPTPADAPPGTSVEVSAESAATVRVHVTAPIRLLWAHARPMRVSASAVAALEPGVPTPRAAGRPDDRSPARPTSEPGPP
ncbi:TadE family type IV pilus minor pilin [Pilimelia anulata]|nr:TadE family type IV pilus minor pilin [Pilimelia anulata]